ncbi:multicopper oxidase domain-containing protein [Desulfoscipio geothermicus]|uniref:Multicopper oxidase with three cupredoxin domains (Includes cell division protein FtsP and spore coat protein CotA) n=1 Tax=Desulfoscipio geothermicus DSM 3669 TaxID=1121426 RepID=A0A1I6DZ89_9FIRM|nr:multicopper oxidase domain-containing protein [Desulfoscipio geothermicus]SFR10850.1 Multicopper oxidase with three cupredoxin domains (includes cell division protein FtsP and spore coat protein CotA) [Desulfoscipio geothermicus DSM 3669]
MPTVNLWATDGYISTPDGKSIYIWGFTDQEGGSARLPGPTIIVKQEAPITETVVTVNLTNNLKEPVSLLFPGQENVKANGQPVQPQYENDILVSLTNHALPGETITYTFTAASPGTFLYESGTNPFKQLQMGLYGAIIVRPCDYTPHDSQYKTAYGAGTDTEFNREYLLITGEIDPDFHQAVEYGQPYEAYKPRYWTINGRCAGDTMLPDNVPHLPNQPCSSMIMMEPGEKVLIRYAGAGVENHPLHPHGNHTRLVGLDGRLLRNQNGGGTTDLSYKRFTVLTGAGQTYDQIYTWTGLGYNPVTNPIPTTLPNLRNMAIGHLGWTMWSGSPYLGQKGELPPDVVSYNQAGEYHLMLHSHAEPEITNWGAFPGGMMTMIAVYPSGTLAPHQGMLPTEAY